MAVPGGDWNETVVRVGDGSEGFDVTPDGKEIWVANAHDGTISIIAMPAKTVGNEYAEFHTGVGVLAIFSSEAQQNYIPHSSEPGINKSVILEFEVANVDKEFARLQGMVKDWVKPPTNQPWGTRSFYFRDPDGDLVDFFMPAALDNENKKGN